MVVNFILIAAILGVGMTIRSRQLLTATVVILVMAIVIFNIAVGVNATPTGVLLLTLLTVGGIPLSTEVRKRRFNTSREVR